MSERITGLAGQLPEPPGFDCNMSGTPFRSCRRGRPATDVYFARDFANNAETLSITATPLSSDTATY